jgi:hypothetical protein
MEVSFTLGRFTPPGKTHGTHSIEGWVGPTAGLDAVMKRKIPSPCRESNTRSSSAIPLSYPGSYAFLYGLTSYIKQSPS